VRTLFRLLVIAVLSLDAHAQQCPVGSHPSVDQWGNRMCNVFALGAATTINGSRNDCPTGTHLWIDKWGNRNCTIIKKSRPIYDNSNWCPVGTRPLVDEWGNRVCNGS